jgi:hypothetical protein
MKERPILFQGAMVRALLAGTKTQTRRAIGGVAPADATSAGVFFAPGKQYDGEWNWLNGDPRDADSWSWVGEPFRCPYGQPGDRLWVRESFMHEPADYCWEASVSIPSRPAETVYRADFPESRPGEGWKPSIHMPRALSRVDLEVTNVRVERLQDISDADAIAEGIEPAEGALHDEWRNYTNPIEYCFTPRGSYQTLWDSINGTGSWDANPWVWVVEFRRVVAP